MAKQRGAAFLDSVLASADACEARPDLPERKARGTSYLAKEMAAANAGLEARLESLERKYNGGEALPTRKIPTNMIHRGPYANRLSSAFDPDRDERFAYLVSQIQATSGNVTPIFVRIVPDKETYELVYGERRWRACMLLGLEVLAIIAEVTDEEAALLQHHENNAKADVSVIERGYQARSWVAHFNGSRQEFAARLGVTESHLHSLLLIGGIPEAFVELHPDPRMVKFKDARDIAVLHRDNPALLQDRMTALQTAGKPLSGRDVLSFLLKGGAPTAAGPTPKARIRRQTLSVPLSSMAPPKRAQFLKEMAALLKKHKLPYDKLS